MKRLGCLVVAVAGAAVLTASSSGAPTSASILIRHQTHGCHAWSVNGGPFRAAQTVRLAVGGTLAVVNNDVMPQAFAEKSGPKAQVRGDAKLGTLGARIAVTFPRAGKYVFATTAGEDYPGVDKPTVGKDNDLTLTVIVS